MNDLFEWKATDKNGKALVNQTTAPAAETEAAILEHLRKCYPNLTITSLERIPVSRYKPATGIIERHAFTRGIYDRVAALIGGDEMESHGKSLLTYVRKLKNGNPRDARDYGVHIQREFDRAIADAQERVRDTRRRAPYGVGRSLLTSHAIRSK